MKAEYGKHYVLDNAKYYWCVQLQRSVQFENPLIVKCNNCFGPFGGHFGNLVNINDISDIITNNEIEFFDNDILKEHELNTGKIFYNDFL